MAKQIASGAVHFDPTVDARVARVIVHLDCAADPALSQVWSYQRDGLHLLLVSVASLNTSTEIERDPVLRGKVRRLAVHAWDMAINAAAVYS